MKRGWWIGKFLAFGMLMLVVLGLVTLLTQNLWNWLVPELFAGPALTFWQTLGLLVLTKIFFWSFGKGGGHWKHQGRPWGMYWQQKMQHLSPEDRDKLKQKMWEKWCSPRESIPEEKPPVANG